MVTLVVINSGVLTYQDKATGKYVDPDYPEFTFEARTSAIPCEVEEACESDPELSRLARRANSFNKDCAGRSRALARFSRRLSDLIGETVEVVIV